MTLPVFETEHLTLRPITAHDAEGLHEAYGDAEAMRHWDLPPSRDVSETAERIRGSYAFRRSRFGARIDGSDDGGVEARSQDYQRLRRELLEAEKAATQERLDAEAATNAAETERLERELAAAQERFDAELADAAERFDKELAAAREQCEAELTAVGVPAVLIPLPIATRDHQTANARALEAAGAAAVVPDDELDTDRLVA